MSSSVDHIAGEYWCINAKTVGMGNPPTWHPSLIRPSLAHLTSRAEWEASYQCSCIPLLDLRNLLSNAVCLSG